ncbi:MAG: proline--tRNA ligase [Candidatus Woesearchaeota archaeon]
MAKDKEVKTDIKGITAKKEEDFGEWYSQLLLKAELIEYSPVSGCYVLRPNCYFIWEQAQAFFDQLIKKDGVKNAYFPMLIPESLLKKESKHVEGFAPEVAWVDYGGDTKLAERLAIRPTSETIMYDSYSKWIRSYKDLPLRINQWCNIVRWEFKHPMPLLRSREFLWQEGHTVFASKPEAVEEALRILDFYRMVFEDLYAVPVMKGQKSESEKFAGADATYSVEAFLPNGKAIQGATSHNLGQNFAKAFEISFLDEKQQRQFGWQNSWGFSTRSIGVMILQHSDEKGLVLPPKVAPVQVVIVPIMFDDTKAKVIAEAKKIEKELTEKGIRAYLDDRDGYTPGWKFNEWEVKGVPVRIELGPKDLDKKQVMLARRDNNEKKALPLTGLSKEVVSLLNTIQSDLLAKGKVHLESSKVIVESLAEAKTQIEKGKLLFVPWCESEGCEENFKFELGGAKTLNAPFDQPKLKPKQNCFACDKLAKRWFYIGKSY